MTHPSDDWSRLAAYVASARQDAGYPTIRSFAAAVGITERTLGALERGERVSRDTLLAVARAVGWTPDSPWRILGGAEPATAAGEPGPGTGQESPPVPRNPFAAAAALAAEPEGDEAWDLFPEPGDRLLRWIWRNAPPEERAGKVREAREWRRAGQDPRGSQSAGLPAPDGNVSDTDLNFV